MTGSTERRALVYDIESRQLVGALENQADAVGSACFHPYAALLGICTGQRHFHADPGTESDSDSGVASPTEDCGAASGTHFSALGQNKATIYGIGRLPTA